MGNLFLTLTNSFWIDSTALLGAPTTPWELILPSGFPFPITLTLQGVIEDDPNIDKILGATNAVILHVQ